MAGNRGGMLTGTMPKVYCSCGMFLSLKLVPGPWITDVQGASYWLLLLNAKTVCNKAILIHDLIVTET